mmetsp:Transcript_63260/g.135951  ORF Transcript_63260/g.135951 Transcript_63260/m.135951 type:complete len:266 (+) Transcript_63260:555-1352(+)
MEMPRRLPSPTMIAPATAVTSPSLITFNGTLPNSFAKFLKMGTTFSLYTSGGTFGKMSHQVASLSAETVPVALPPMASTLGSVAAVSFMAVSIISQWYCGSAFVTSHSVSLDSTTLLSFIATVLMSLFPRSKARRHPEASCPHLIGLSTAFGRADSEATIETSNGLSGVPQTFGIVSTSNLNFPLIEKASFTLLHTSCGPQSCNDEALLSHIISWMSTPAKKIVASKYSLASGKQSKDPRAQQSSARGSAHSNVLVQFASFAHFK